jgi:hypothetical protein
MKLDIGDFELIIVCDRCLHHIETIEFVKESFLWLKGILWGNNEPHFIEIGILGHDIGNNKMANVYWIK